MDAVRKQRISGPHELSPRNPDVPVIEVAHLQASSMMEHHIENIVNLSTHSTTSMANLLQKKWKYKELFHGMGGPSKFDLSDLASRTHVLGHHVTITLYVHRTYLLLQAFEAFVILVSSFPHSILSSLIDFKCYWKQRHPLNPLWKSPPWSTSDASPRFLGHLLTWEWQYSPHCPWPPPPHDQNVGTVSLVCCCLQWLEHIQSQG